MLDIAVGRGLTNNPVRPPVLQDFGVLLERDWNLTSAPRLVLTGTEDFHVWQIHPQIFHPLPGNCKVYQQTFNPNPRQEFEYPPGYPPHLIEALGPDSRHWISSRDWSIANLSEMDFGIAYIPNCPFASSKNKLLELYRDSVVAVSYVPPPEAHKRGKLEYNCSNSKFQANLSAQYLPIVNTIIKQSGLDTAVSKSQSHEGHSLLRDFTDINTAALLNKFRNDFTNSYRTGPDNIEIIDVGSKYGSYTSMIIKATAVSARGLDILLDVSDGARVWVEAESKWINKPGTQSHLRREAVTNQIYTIWNDYANGLWTPALDTQCAALIRNIQDIAGWILDRDGEERHQANAILHEVLTAIHLWWSSIRKTRVWWKPVRPTGIREAENNYDETYSLQNRWVFDRSHPKWKDLIGDMAGQSLLPTITPRPYQAKIEEVFPILDYSIQVQNRFYLLIDSAYYLSNINWTAVPAGMAYAIYTEYPGLPARYDLPGQNGSASVFPLRGGRDQVISRLGRWMFNLLDDCGLFDPLQQGSAPLLVEATTSGNTQKYTHPVVMIRGSTNVLNLGWMSINAWQGPTHTLNIQTKRCIRTAPVGMEEIQWVQRAFYSDCCQSSIPTHWPTIDRSLKIWEKFTEQISETYDSPWALMQVLASLWPGKLEGIKISRESNFIIRITEDVIPITELKLHHHTDQQTLLNGDLTRSRQLRIPSTFWDRVAFIGTKAPKHWEMSTCWIQKQIDILYPKKSAKAKKIDSFQRKVIEETYYIDLQKCKPIDFYVDKPIPTTIVELDSNVVPCLRKHKEHNDKAAADFLRWLESTNDQPMPKVLEDCEDTTVVIKGCQEVRSYEFQKDRKNAKLSASYGRHYATRVTPDPEVVGDFKRYVRQDLQKRMPDPQTFESQLISPNEWVKKFGMKKAKEYLRSILKLAAAPQQGFSWSFTLMIKEGETYIKSTKERIDANGFLHDSKNRARGIWVPSKELTGPLTYIQSGIFPFVKEAFPEFCHGKDLQGMKDSIGDLAKEFLDPVFLSLDGSGYDSTQFRCLIDAVDGQFWEHIRPWIRAVAIDLADRFWPDLDIDSWTNMILTQAQRNVAILWIHTPGANNVHSPRLLSNWRKTQKSRSINDPLASNWTCFKVDGTTYSGHPSKTTLGNTLRSIYYYRYISHKAGVRTKILASGDDVVMTCERKDADWLRNTIRHYTLIDKSQAITKGLGQVVEEIKIGEMWDLDFCSKLLLPTASPDPQISRDMYKAVTTNLKWSNRSKIPRGDWWKSIWHSAQIEWPDPHLRETVTAHLERLGIDVPTAPDPDGLIHKNWVHHKSGDWTQAEANLWKACMGITWSNLQDYIEWRTDAIVISDSAKGLG